MLLGVAVASILGESAVLAHPVTIALALLSLCFASSANYVMNESLDTITDKHHPTKGTRPSISHELNKTIVALEYAALAGSALILSYCLSADAGHTIGLYLICAWAYNIRPVRIKDIAYADVLLESFNYPLRVLLGWQVALPGTLPPSSILIICWSMGAFAMSLKRLAELQLFTTSYQAASYRRSYLHYNVPKLAVCAFAYGMLTIFGITIFMIKYRTELLLLTPLLIIWMCWYFWLGLQQDLRVIYPERLLANRLFSLLTILILAAAALLLNVSLPQMHIYHEPLEFHIPAQSQH